MAFIELVRDDEAEDAAAELLDVDRERMGYVPNYARLFARRPTVYAAWRQLVGAVGANIDPRRYELATISAARALGSSYCMLAHGKVLADRFYEPATLAQIVREHRAAGLDEVDVAIMDLAAQVATDAAAVTQEDVDRLIGLGLTEAEILDVVLAAAARSFFSKTLDALGVEADAAYGSLEPALREALTVGRPIASE
jgi:uncharacterized peroxidase-related enzyme